MSLAEGIRRGDPRSISKAISAVENATPEGFQILDAVAPLVGRAVRIGVTGPPGVGKSTAIDAIARDYRTRGRKVGVLAVDPTSPFTGGALLGDRIRMTFTSEDPGVFVRSMASRGHAGGLARATQDAADILDAAGIEVVLLETVGVGQSEIEIARATDVTIVILSPESGDGIQAMKSGLMEIADLLVINKADRAGADRLEHDLRSAFDLRPAANRRDIPILLTEAFKGKGIPELLAAAEGLLEKGRQDGSFRARRERNMRERLRGIAEYMVQRNLWADGASEGRLASLAGEVLNHARTSYGAAEELVRSAKGAR